MIVSWLVQHTAVKALTHCSLTRIGHLDLDHAALEGLAIQSKSLLEAFELGELDVAKALGTLHLAVFNDADADNLTALKEFGDGLDGRIVGKVTEMGGERRLVGKLSGDVFADRGETCSDNSWLVPL